MGGKCSSGWQGLSGWLLFAPVPLLWSPWPAVVTWICPLWCGDRWRAEEVWKCLCAASRRSVGKALFVGKLIKLLSVTSQVTAPEAQCSAERTHSSACCFLSLSSNTGCISKHSNALPGIVCWWCFWGRRELLLYLLQLWSQTHICFLYYKGCCAARWGELGHPVERWRGCNALSQK